MEAVLPPHIESSHLVHRHPGSEAWHVLEGAQCLAVLYPKDRRCLSPVSGIRSAARSSSFFTTGLNPGQLWLATGNPRGCAGNSIVPGGASIRSSGAETSISYRTQPACSLLS
jgi:hypothetical protein